MIEVVAGLAGAGLCAVGGALMPAVVAQLPEPEAEAEAETGSEPAPKQTYAAIAELPGLAWKLAVAAALTGFAIGGRLGWEWSLLILLPLVPLLTALALIDWRTHLLPTKLVWPTTLGTAALVGIAWLVTGDNQDLARSGGGFVIAYGTFFVLWFVYPKGLGYGDVRLAGVLGLALGYLGWGELLLGLYAGFLLGGVGGGLLTLAKVVQRKAFPFGPFMVMGALLGVLCGAQLLDRLVVG